MKQFFLSILLATATLLSANDPTIYRDEDTGLVLEIPGGLERTWNLSHSQIGMEMNIFQTNDYPTFLITTIKIPAASLSDTESGVLFTDVMKEIQESLNSFEMFTFEELPSLASSDYPSQRLRFTNVKEENDAEDDINIIMDTHLFYREDYITIIGTIVGNPNEDAQSIDDFSRAVLETTRFIEE